MKRLIAPLLTLILVSCASASPARGMGRAAIRSNPLADVMHNTVELQGEDGRVFCTGVITHDAVVTAAHCADEPRIRVETRDARFLVRVLRIDEVQDVAVLVPVDGRKLGKGVSLARRAPGFAANIWVIGHARGEYVYSITRGIVSFPRRVGGPYEGMVWMQHDAGAVGGNSGGPVVNSRGQLVGITSFGVLQPVRCMFSCDGIYESTHLAGAVHWESLNKILRDL